MHYLQIANTVYHISTNWSFWFSKIFNWFFLKKSNSKQKIYSNGMINVCSPTYKGNLWVSVERDESRWRWLIVSKYVSIYLTGTIKIHHQQYNISYCNTKIMLMLMMMVLRKCNYDFFVFVLFCRLTECILFHSFLWYEKGWREIVMWITRNIRWNQFRKFVKRVMVS